MKTVRSYIITIQVLAYALVFFWIYATNRFDELNVGGRKGDVQLWNLMLKVGFYGSVLAWIASILIAIIYSRKFRSIQERAFWLTVSCFGVPILAFFW